MKGMCVPLAEVERLLKAKDKIIAEKDAEIAELRAWVAKEDE